MNNHKPTKKKVIGLFRRQKYTVRKDTLEVHLLENLVENAKKKEGKGQEIMDFL